VRRGGESPDGFRIALHHGHRNAKIMPRGDEVVIERLDLNRVTEGMSRAELAVLIMPEVL
jgi:hypothetical protein